MFSVSSFQMNFQVCVPIRQKDPVGWHGWTPPNGEFQVTVAGVDCNNNAPQWVGMLSFVPFAFPLRSLGSTFWNPFVQLPKFQDFLTRSSEINLKDFSRCPTFSNRLGFFVEAKSLQGKRDLWQLDVLGMFWSTQKSWSWESLRVGESLFWASHRDWRVGNKMKQLRCLGWWQFCEQGVGIVVLFFLIDHFDVVEVALYFRLQRGGCWLRMKQF